VTPDPDDPARPDPSADDGLRRRQEREAAGSEGTGERVDAGVATAVVDAPERSAADERRAQQKTATRNTIEWIAVIVGAIVIAIVVRTFVLQTFWIPSPSMSPTLVEDDRVLVNKLSYRFHDINRGDVIVFERPPNEQPSAVKDLIKRVVGLPGDRVSIVEGSVSIDGRPLEEPYVDGLQTTYDGSCNQPGVDLTGLDTEGGFVVPDGQLFVMGDNRVNSHDGRCFGPIDDDLVVGRAFFILWPPSHAGGL
jgi:signal peptidase I